MYQCGKEEIIFVQNINKKTGQYGINYIYTFYSLKLKYILYNLLTHTNNIFCRYSVRTFNIVWKYVIDNFTEN